MVGSSEEEHLNTCEAADEAKTTQQTIRAWCLEYGIGIKVGGRWRIDRKQLAKMLDGTMDKELRRRYASEEVY